MRSQPVRRRAKPAADPAKRSHHRLDRFAPERYVARIDRATGLERPGPIAPEELTVQAGPDLHPVKLAVRVMASRVVELTGSEWLAAEAVGALRGIAGRAAAVAGLFGHNHAVEAAARRLIGVCPKTEVFRFRPPTTMTAEALKARVARLKAEAAAALSALGPHPRLTVLLTGATGFLGQEVLVQAARDPHVEELVCLVRPRRLRDPQTGRVHVMGAARRGARLLARLGITGAAARRFRFVEGDVEKPGLGLGARETQRLRCELTHVIHCAASVAFDGSYDDSVRANVVGSLNALDFSLGVQRSKRSRFVAHVAIETSYVHGRLGRRAAKEGSLAFPARLYNNYYELTKAMASLETDRAMLERGLRVTQLMPSIIIGDARTGNNRGDTKVINGPINAFGRARAALAALSAAGWLGRLRGRLIASVATTFPADRSAELNLVPVDRVAAGVLAALTAPDSIGARIHLATDHRIRTEQMSRVIEEELDVRVRTVDPTLARTVALPAAAALVSLMGQDGLARSLQKLSGIFGGYSEWGQPVHAVGADMRTLGLPSQRPDTGLALRMLCRHNRYVQQFGVLKDEEELARREALWAEVVDAIEYESGRPAGEIPAVQFRHLVEAQLDLTKFRRRPRPYSGAA
jgi:nucleoside-diphosphate-sugar epimerase